MKRLRHGEPLTPFQKDRRRENGGSRREYAQVPASELFVATYENAVGYPTI